ncbi:S1 RNA-binding domain-containing protein [Methanosarcinaceae archaeon]|nr:S1 RNA-binding domain-containing protein [Methanosarcinaceae archaeon]
MDKRIVIPGEWLSNDPSLSGKGTYVKAGNVYASLCGLLVEKSRLSVIPFAGPYMPAVDDLVIGYVTTVTPSNWIFDIGCPYEALLHVSEYPLRVPSEEMSQHFDVGDAVILRVRDVNEEMKIELTYKDPSCRKLNSGVIIDIPVSKISRVIGRSGSMISMLKSKTGCSIFVGYNGRIVADGRSEDIRILTSAVRRIQEMAHLSGLTDRISQYIDDLYASAESAGKTDISAETPGLPERKEGTVSGTVPESPDDVPETAQEPSSVSDIPESSSVSDIPESSSVSDIPESSSVSDIPESSSVSDIPESVSVSAASDDPSDGIVRNAPENHETNNDDGFSVSPKAEGSSYCSCFKGLFF